MFRLVNWFKDGPADRCGPKSTKGGHLLIPQLLVAVCVLVYLMTEKNSRLLTACNDLLTRYTLILSTESIMTVLVS